MTARMTVGPRALARTHPSNDHGSMKRIGWPALLALLVVGCVTPAPRVPFRSGGWHASVLGGTWPEASGLSSAGNVAGVEYVLDQPGTSGWGFEAAFRFAQGDGKGSIKARNPATPNNTNFTLKVPTEEDIDHYELSFGVRQTYREDADFQPYFGVGLAVQETRLEADYVQPAVPPSIPVDQNKTDHERSEPRPAVYLHTGLIWNVLRDQVAEKTEFPIAFDMRVLWGVEYSYLEFSIAFGFGR